MAKLYYQGHGSLRIATDDGAVIYVDPFAGDGYDLPADIILVTHSHRDHNKISRCKQNEGCRIITHKDALSGGRHRTFSVGGVTIEAVEAHNLMHSRKRCVGYIITTDGVTVYVLGDTGITKQMESFAERKLDYALFPCDGVFNMNLKQAAECARLICARHNVPIHLRLHKIFDRERADEWDAPNKLIIPPGEEIQL
jgi:Predicted Zn-dependent hydrolases of the beta-lactamase fold